VAGGVGCLGDDHPSGLVAEDEWSGDDVGADAAVVIVVDVGAADPDRPDLDQHFLGAGLGHRDLLDAQVADAMQDGRSILHRWSPHFLSRAVGRTGTGGGRNTTVLRRTAAATRGVFPVQGHDALLNAVAL
jgi:hypothetical protein